MLTPRCRSRQDAQCLGLGEAASPAASLSEDACRPWDPKNAGGTWWFFGWKNIGKDGTIFGNIHDINEKKYRKVWETHILEPLIIDVLFFVKNKGLTWRKMLVDNGLFMVDLQGQLSGT